jgi:hypothetical protein
MKDKVYDRRESHFLQFRFPIRNQSFHKIVQTWEEILLKLRNAWFNLVFLYKESTNKLNKILKTINLRKNCVDSYFWASYLYPNYDSNMHLLTKIGLCITGIVIFVQVSDKDSFVKLRSFFLWISKMNNQWLM